MLQCVVVYRMEVFLNLGCRLLCVAVCCSVLQCVAWCCSVLHGVVKAFGPLCAVGSCVLQCDALCCYVNAHRPAQFAEMAARTKIYPDIVYDTVTLCTLLQHTATHCNCNTLQHIATLQHTATLTQNDEMATRKKIFVHIHATSPYHSRMYTHSTTHVCTHSHTHTGRRDGSAHKDLQQAGTGNSNAMAWHKAPALWLFGICLCIFTYVCLYMSMYTIYTSYVYILYIDPLYVHKYMLIAPALWLFGICLMYICICRSYVYILYICPLYIHMYIL